ncbi:hypothetical protein KRX54_05830 [Actinomycetaceae bacterium TAE3-ERU4]|nr:hypothetical protein [Actinomycetaceae bacterium TAE3-ERU4]
MTANEKDFNCREFSRLLATLEEHLPISDEYDGVDLTREDGNSKRKVWYTSQREHMVAWFSDQPRTGTGPYSRSKPNLSAKRAYNRLLNVGSILWINEALGVDEQQIRMAAEMARKESDYRRRCAIARKYLPWEKVLEKALQFPLPKPFWKRIFNL